MKKILYVTLALMAGAAAFSSCSLEQYPDKALSTEDAMESAADCNNFLIGIYAASKSLFSGFYMYSTDFMTDSYHAVKNYGNWDGDYYTYHGGNGLTASDSGVWSVWANYYSVIGNCNFLIAGAEKVLAKEGISDDEKAQVQEYMGVAKFMRAFLYFRLTQYFCKDYDPASAESVFGVPVVTKYEPTGDASKYPHRGTLAQTYKQIDEDIAEAEKFVKTAGEPDYGYVSADAVQALKARVALSKHDWKTAYAAASALVDAGTYPLQTDAKKYADGWVNDNLGEAIWQPIIVDSSDGGSACSYFVHNTSGKEGEDDPQYFPEKWVLDLYAAGDIRYDAYFTESEINMRGNVGKITMLTKFNGNPKLNTSAASRYINMPKVFRISEMYLIAAEAAAENNDSGNAAKYLNALQTARGAAVTGASKDEIRAERNRELFGEGFRLSDIKRYHIGFTRDNGQDPSMIQDTGYKLSLPADSPKFIWPIPTKEMEANPQMENEQNEGYSLEG
ncbi:MAG: RagB/SusD family nutrient uptake outer membrane protein [Bacteroidales bacterium]|nr:RagB/SusD family nutrient uptake outer membrane protein [Bacteroidales bacterium]